MADPDRAVTAPRIWQIGALCRAIADALEVRFNPVAVRGEISGFSRPASGHCYFALKDSQGQLRCAMFKRAAGLLDFVPRDGDSVEVMGRLAVYEPRGDLQLIVESLRPAGQGALYEQFMRLKARLEAQGLFDSARKRLPLRLPRGIGVVTSLQAAALHDVATALRRRASHIPVIVAPAAVQGSQAAAELISALQALYRLAEAGSIDTILLVRGGGSIEDLWAFNDEQLARTIVRSPVPLVCGVGHETDFTIADFCADVRAPTPTAAAELAAQARDTWVAGLDGATVRLSASAVARLDLANQRLDQASSRLGRPLARMATQRLRLGRAVHRLSFAIRARLDLDGRDYAAAESALQQVIRLRLALGAEVLERARLRLELMDPRLVLKRGYALLNDSAGKTVTRASQTHPGQDLIATLSDGEVALTVTAPSRISS